MYRIGIVRMPMTVEVSLAVHSFTPQAFIVCAVRMIETGTQFLVGRDMLKDELPATEVAGCMVDQYKFHQSKNSIHPVCRIEAPLRAG
jgi:hypothetical protein